MKKICYISVFAFFSILFSENEISPRILILLKQEELASALAKSSGARILNVESNELEVLITEIRKLDGEMSDNNRRIMIKEPSFSISDLKRLAQKVGYGFIEIESSDVESALQSIIEREKIIPKTDKDLPRIDSRTVGSMYKILMDLGSVLKAHKLDYWAVYGTLLGAVRHSGIIPWVDVISLGMHESDLNILLSLEYELEKLGLRIIKHHLGFYKVFPINGKDIELDDYLKKRFPQGLGWKFPFIDIFPVVKNESGYTHSDNKLAQLWQEACLLTSSELKTFEYLSFGPTEIPVPNGYKDVLNRLYGHDWPYRTYIKYSYEKECPLSRVDVKLVDASPASYEL